MRREKRAERYHKARKRKIFEEMMKLPDKPLETKQDVDSFVLNYTITRALAAMRAIEERDGAVDLKTFKVHEESWDY